MHETIVSAQDYTRYEDAIPAGPLISKACSCACEKPKTCYAMMVQRQLGA